MKTGNHSRFKSDILEGNKMFQKDGNPDSDMNTKIFCMDGNLIREKNTTSLPGSQAFADILENSCNVSDIGLQLDGNISSSESSFSSWANPNDPDSDDDTNDEDDDILPPADLTVKNPSNQPVELEVKKISRLENASSLPLVSVLNARSLYQKKDNFKSFINELGIELAIILETWERDEENLDTLLELENHKILSYKRPKVKARKQPGGGCALIYSENRFCVTQLSVPILSGVEAVWALVKPKEQNRKLKKLLFIPYMSVHLLSSKQKLLIILWRLFTS